MAFGRNQELTKEDLIKAGLNPDDLAEMKANGVKKSDLETLKTELSTSLATSMAEQIKNGFAELETKLSGKSNNNNNNNNNNNDTNNNNNNVDDSDEMLNDPAGYVKKKVTQGIVYNAIQTTKLRMDLAFSNARNNLKGFKNEALAKEIEDEWKQYKAEAFATNKDFDPDALIKKIHNMVMGNHMEEIQRDTDKKEGKYNMVASGSGGGGGNFNNNNNQNSNNNNTVELTEVEKKQAARYGMKPEEWQKQQKEMQEEEEKVLARS